MLITVVTAGQSPKEAAQGAVITLNFVDEDVCNIIALYEKLTNLKIIRDHWVRGKMTVSVAERVSRDKAVEIIERSFFADGFAIIQIDSDMVEIVGPEQNPRTRGIPVITDPKDLPSHERVISYLFKFKYRNAATMQQAIGAYVSPPQPYTSLIAEPDVNILLLTERSSVVRHLIEIMAKADIPDGRTSPPSSQSTPSDRNQPLKGDEKGG